MGDNMLNYEKRKWIIKQLDKGASVTNISRAQSISRQAVYDVKKLYDNNGLAALHDQKIGRPEESISSTIKQQIIQLRRTHPETRSGSDTLHIFRPAPVS